MRKEMLELMRVMSSVIAADETLARGMSLHAEALEADGYLDAASAVRELVSTHRVKALEIQGGLGALRKQYTMQFHDVPWASP